MIGVPERSAERDAAIEAMLPHVPFDGWTRAALRLALAESGADPADAEMLFPRGAADMVEAFCDLADRQMAADAADEVAGEASLTRRVRAVIAARLARQAAHKEAIRRALSVLALPHNAPVAAACTARTVDAVWRAAGDHPADFSWYTKRALLAGVYGTTVLFWLRDASPDGTDTLAFLDRRLADIGRIGRLRGRAESVAARFLPGPLRQIIAGPGNPAEAR